MVAKIALILACILATPFLLLGAFCYLALLFAATIAGLAYVRAGLTWLRFQIWRITR